jgi:hypothetical protein
VENVRHRAWPPRVAARDRLAVAGGLATLLFTLLVGFAVAAMSHNLAHVWTFVFAFGGASSAIARSLLAEQVAHSVATAEW